jgi:DUF971 family protein
MKSAPADPGNTPLRIHADRPNGRLEIEWRDGHQTAFAFAELRWLCPCATCRGEGGMPGWLDSNPTLTVTQTTLIDVRLVGSYAIQPTWGDGHATGYYGFTNLRASCSCPDCTAQRAGERGLDDATPRAGAGAHAAHAPEGGAR